MSIKENKILLGNGDVAITTFFARNADTKEFVAGVGFTELNVAVLPGTYMDSPVADCNEFHHVIASTSKDSLIALRDRINEAIVDFERKQNECNE